MGKGEGDRAKYVYSESELSTIRPSLKGFLYRLSGTLPSWHDAVLWMSYISLGASLCWTQSALAT